MCPVCVHFELNVAAVHYSLSILRFWLSVVWCHCLCDSFASKSLLVRRRSIMYLLMKMHLRCGLYQKRGFYLRFTVIYSGPKKRDHCTWLPTWFMLDSRRLVQVLYGCRHSNAMVPFLGPACTRDGRRLEGAVHCQLIIRTDQFSSRKVGGYSISHKTKMWAYCIFRFIQTLPFQRDMHERFC